MYSFKASMSEIYKCQLTVRERLKLQNKLTNFEIKSGCHIWSGGNLSPNGYGTIRTVFRGKRKRFFCSPSFVFFTSST